MPTNMVPIGGAKPVQEVGTEFNSQMTNNIMQLASQVAAENIAKTKAMQVIEGKARVAQGESLESIRASQGVFDKIFGQATIQGAKAQTVIQATDQHVLHMQTNMQNYRHLTTEDFIEQQNKYVADNLITGDPTVDHFITLASAEAIADSTSLHAKEHALFVQEQSKVEFENTLMGSSKRVHSVLSNPSVNIQDKVKALQSLQERIQILPGQSQSAYMSSVADVMISELKADRPALYQGLMKGGFEIDGTVIDTGDPLQFDPSTTTKIEEAYIAHKGRTDVANAMSEASSFAALRTASDNLTILDEELSDMVTQHLGTYGADSLTMTQVASLFTERGASRLKDTQKRQGILDIVNGQSRTNTDRTKVANDMNLFEAALLEKVESLPSEQQEQAMQDASALVLQKAIDNDVVPTSWTARWNNGFASLITKDGKANPAFIKTMQHFNSKYHTKPELFQKGIDKLALAKALGVQNLMQTQGIEIEEALIQYESNILTPEEAQKVTQTKAFREKVEDFVDDPDQKSWFTFGLFDSFEDLENKFQVRESFKQHLLDNVARTGDLGEGAWQGAIDAWKATHERVNNLAVPNYGTPLRIQAGMYSADKTFDDALTHYLFNKGKEKFGEGFDPENVQLRFQPGYVQITPVNPDGTYIPGVENSGGRIPLKAIGNYYNETVSRPLLKKKIDVRNMDISEFADETLYAQQIQENKTAVELAKGGKLTGSKNDIRIYKALQDPKKGPKLKTLLETIPEQSVNGDAAGMLKTIQSISELTGFVPEDEE